MRSIGLFLCGDVMTGRGIDQILQFPGEPAIHEGFLQSAADYVSLAESEGGPIPRGVEPGYIWGEALEELEAFRPHARIINLETAVTASGDWLPKGINYRMNPANIACLTAAGIDCCALANNHVLDWGETGLVETLETLERAGIRTAGAGRERDAAETPVVISAGDGRRILVYAVGMESSGVPAIWAAGAGSPGVDFLPDLSTRSVERLARRVTAAKRPGDVVVLSIHWGPNWGYGIAPGESRFAHALVDAAGVDVVHGHSSHHARAVEIYRGRPILYGCGDFINDYEGIRGNESYRPDLRPMYLLTLEGGPARLTALEVVVLRSQRFRLCRAGAADTRWLASLLDAEGRPLGARARPLGGNRIALA